MGAGVSAAATAALTAGIFERFVFLLYRPLLFTGTVISPEYPSFIYPLLIRFTLSLRRSSLSLDRLRPFFIIS
jgi:hypothetical protein